MAINTRVIFISTVAFIFVIITIISYHYCTWTFTFEVTGYLRSRFITICESFYNKLFQWSHSLSLSMPRFSFQGSLSSHKPFHYSLTGAEHTSN